jgi:hypothetical protein
MENFTKQFEMQMWVWANFDPNHEMWLSRLEAMTVAKVPITNIVALGLGGLHEAYPSRKCVFIDNHPTFIGTGSGVQLAVVMMIREVLGGMS